MKKAILLALAALSVSVAQAVTCTWTTMDSSLITAADNSTYQASTGASLVLSPDLNSNGVVSSDFPTSGTISLSSILLLQRGNGTRTDYGSLSIVDSEGNVVATSTSVSSTSGYLLYDQAGGYYTRVAYTFLFDESVSTLDVTETYTIYAYDTTGTLSALTVTATTAGDGYLPALTITGSYEVPEPTVLALLALGVAGIALRRKA